jgi:hypothetical protein
LPPSSPGGAAASADIGHSTDSTSSSPAKAANSETSATDESTSNAPPPQHLDLDKEDANAVAFALVEALDSAEAQVVNLVALRIVFLVISFLNPRLVSANSFIFQEQTSYPVAHFSLCIPS